MANTHVRANMYRSKYCSFHNDNCGHDQLYWGDMAVFNHGKCVMIKQSWNKGHDEIDFKISWIYLFIFIGWAYTSRLHFKLH